MDPWTTLRGRAPAADQTLQLVPHAYSTASVDRVTLLRAYFPAECPPVLTKCGRANRLQANPSKTEEHGAHLAVANTRSQLRRQSVRIGATYVLLVTLCRQWLCSMTPINYVVYIHEWESICGLWSLIATFFSKMKDFSRLGPLQAVTYTAKVVVSKKWCKIDTLLLHTTNKNVKR